MSSRRADGATMVRFLHKLSPRELKRTCRNAAIDLQYGGFSGGYIRNPAPGAHGTGATDYDIMPQLFAGRIRPGDVLVDVGCGKGRVINWWLSQGHQNRIYGLELLPEIAEFTRKRLRKFRNVSIVTGDAIENLPSDGDVFFLFNPFDDRIMPGFIERLWGVAERRDITIVYFAPVYLHLFHSDTRWSVEELDVQLPKAGLFDPRHRRFAVIRPARLRERLKSR
jgi:SAM-dependent methyltransferase